MSYSGERKVPEVFLSHEQIVGLFDGTGPQQFPDPKTPDVKERKARRSSDSQLQRLNSLAVDSYQPPDMVEYDPA